jgi:hypothetical protein
MKRTVVIVIGAILVLATAAPAMAQIQITIPGFRNDFPWFTNVPQAQTFEQFLANHPDDERELAQNPGLLYDPNWRAQHRELQYFLQTHPDVWEGLKAQGAGIYDTRFSQFLNNHPDVASDLRDDPELLYDPRYRENHPELVQFLANHPRVWANLNAQRETAGPAPGELGAYDDVHQWHDAGWWWANNPDWVRGHHPTWWGGYDNGHVWRPAAWWWQNNPNWVRHHHPEWWGDWDDGHVWQPAD